MRSAPRARAGHGHCLPRPPTWHLVERLNREWRLAGANERPASLKQRVALPFRRALARAFGPQETFNAAVVQFINHLNASAAAREAVHEAILDTFETAREEVDRYREALAARERRIDTAMAALRSQQDELRTSVGALQAATHHVTRIVERLERSEREEHLDRSGRAERANRSDRSLGSERSGSEDPNNPHVPNVPHVPDALSHKYLGFEDQFRGSAAAIRERLTGYVLAVRRQRRRAGHRLWPRRVPGVAGRAAASARAAST